MAETSPSTPRRSTRAVLYGILAAMLLFYVAAWWFTRSRLPTGPAFPGADQPGVIFVQPGK